MERGNQRGSQGSRFRDSNHTSRTRRSCYPCSSLADWRPIQQRETTTALNFGTRSASERTPVTASSGHKVKCRACECGRALASVLCFPLVSLAALTQNPPAIAWLPRVAGGPHNVMDGQEAAIEEGWPAPQTTRPCEARCQQGEGTAGRKLASNSPVAPQ